MNPRERAELIKEATHQDWMRKPRGKSFLDLQRGERRLEVRKEPDFIYNKEGEIVGIDAWVCLYDASGKELKIDPHRRIINPPTVPRSGIVETGEGENRFRLLTPDPVEAFYEAVWDSVESVPNPRGWRTRGTVTTVFSATSDGYINSDSSVYSTARAGNALSANTTDTTNGIWIGQRHLSGPEYDCWEAFVSFDTSSINDADVISSVVLDLYLTLDDADSAEFTVQAREHDWGASLTTADWVAGASLSGLTLMATLDTTSIGAVNAYKTFTSESGFVSATNMKTGVVYLLLCSSRHADGNEPGVASWFEFVTFSSSDVTGTTQDPKLTITHSTPNAMPFYTSRPNRIWRLG